MTARRVLIAFLTAALMVAGCGATGSVESAAGPCQTASPPVVGAAPICARAVALAEARLGWLHWPVTSTRFRSDICPPNARCAVRIFNQGWVIFEFSMGDPVMVHVGPTFQGDVATDVLVADAPEPLPDWLAEELQASG